VDIHGNSVSDEQIKEYIMELIEGEGYAYGYHKLTICLRRKYKLVINKKKVYRLCKELDVLKPQRRVKRKHPRRVARNRTVTAPNQLWEMDVKYGYICGEDRFFFFMSIIDVYDRMIVDYHIGLSCLAQDAITTLKGALLRRQLYQADKLPVIRTDSGPQFLSDAFEATCRNLGLEHERIPFKTPNKNAHIEAFHRILEEECLSLYEFQSYAEAYQVVTEFIKYYNDTRIHSSINYLSPREFHKAFIQNSAKRLVIKA
jgi:putative transposase